MAEPQQTSWRAIVGLLVGSLVVALLLFEVVLARFVPFPDPYARYKKINFAPSYVPSAHQRDFSMPITVEPNVPGIPAGTTKFTTNNYGFRGPALTMPKPADETRIFLIGGSVVECLLLDDPLSLDRVVSGYLRDHDPQHRHVTVYNAGKSGDKSFDHIAMLVHRITHLQPDVVVLLMGVNDLSGANAGIDYLMFPGEHIVEYDFLTLTKFMLTELQLFRRFEALVRSHRKSSATEEQTRIEYRSRLAEGVAFVNTLPPATAPPQTNLPAYRDNTRTLVGVLRAQGIRTLLVTHGSSWNSAADPGTKDRHWMTALLGRYRFPEDQLDRALESYNDVVRDAAAQYGVALYDAAREIPKTREYYYDDVHFNIQGARTAGEHIGERILQHRLLDSQPPPNDAAATPTLTATPSE